MIIFLFIAVAIVIIWTNLYKYQTTERFVYRTNILTHKTQYLIGNKEWADLEIRYPESAPAAEEY